MAESQLAYDTKPLVEEDGSGGHRVVVRVGSIVALEVATIASVTIASLPSVTVAAIPSVTVASIPSVTVGSIPSVTIGAPLGASLSTASVPVVLATDQAAAQVIVSSVTAAKLQKDGQDAEGITCTSFNTDYEGGAIPAGTKYVRAWAANMFQIAVDEQTSTNILGMMVPANAPEMFPVSFGAVGGDGKVHVQSSTTGTVVYCGYLSD